MAGELSALEELLTHLPPHPGMALILVSAGVERQPDLLLELLRALAPIPVLEIAAGLALQVDHLYVAPPGALPSLDGGTLVLAPWPKEAGGVMIIDHFFHSLALNMRSRAIGIVLSGCEADGALGLKAIKGEGGIAIVQDESSSRSAGVMQRTAVAPDAVDLVVKPVHMGQELCRIARQLERTLGSGGDKEDKPSPSEEQHLLAKIYVLLRKATGVDFSFYKQTTLRRRIARRMVVQRVSTLKEYARHLQANLSELKELYEDMLINVTRFFRDPEMFASLRSELLPLMLRERPSEQPIRIWVPGCASGEEVYSLAITLLEHLGSVPFDTPIQIFGTDISDRSIERARAAVYPESSLAEMAPDRLRRFFVKVEGGYQVVKRLRDLCVFARQNLASDPPFSRLDLISCRNVLIYLGPALQKTIIPTFHYALKPTGFLLLGNSETIRDYTNLFVLLDKKHKFYAKNSASGYSALELSSRVVPPELIEPLPYDRAGSQEGGNEMELQRAADRIILARFGPAGVIVNERAEILQSRGHTSPFLELPSGIATLNLLRMIKESIAREVRDGLQRAVSDDIPVRLDGLQLSADDKSTLTVEILPIQSQGRSTRCFLVLFLSGAERRPARTPASAPTDACLPLAASADEKDREILQLRNDLDSTKQYLQSLLEERDATNQELISANEEIQSSNEELQSINEELETAKEELQSTNEELQTVNEELYNRNLELSQTSNDLVNLLNSITIPVLILGSDLRIRQFTPIAERMMNVRPTDIGRPIGEIRLNLHLDDLEPILLDVIETLSPKELEVQDRTGRWHLLRARPYRTADNKIDGVVVVLVDIDQIRKSQQQLMDARDFAQAVVTGAQVPLAVLGRDLRIKTASRAFFELCGLTSDQVEGAPFNELAARLWSLDPSRPLLAILNARAGEPAEFELEHETGGVDSKFLHIKARAILTDGERVCLVALQDITARKLAEHVLQAEKERLEGQVQVTERALDRTQEELRDLAASLFTAQEEERRRVSRELHDDLAQKVALLDLDTARLTPSLSEPPQRRQLDELRQHISELAADLRRIAYQLHPTILDDLGLAFALKQLSEEFGRREDMPVRFASRGTPIVSPIVSGSLYRITQEALRNVAKHAGKTQVNVSLTATPRELRLQIRDHGNGFEPSEARGRGMGILNMEERARLVGGSFLLKAFPGKGVSILVRVPISQSDP